jgi:antitoxin component YwqK of YwqJK toxin-antitoxin module
MNIKQIIAGIILILFSMPITAQMETGTYQGYKIDKNRTEEPDYITIHVVELAWAFCWFTEEKPGKPDTPLDGAYRIIVNNRKYYVGDFTKGFIHGNWEYYFYDNLTEKGVFDAGRPNGKYTDYYESGSINRETIYKRKDYTSIMQRYISYHENGQVEVERTYDENGRLNGHIITYDEKGNVREDKVFVHGNIQGKSIKKESNGDIITAEYEDNNPVSEEIRYSNGNLKSKGAYNADKQKNGKWISGLENGDPESETDYLNGKKNGEEKIYFKNKLLRSVINYTNDKKDGKEIVYDETPHTILYEGTYRDGVRHGLYKAYHNGILWKETVYQEDNVVSEKQYEEGKLQLLNLLDETGTLVNVEKYNDRGEKTYKNTSYRKHPSIKIKEDASGIIDIDIK